MPSREAELERIRTIYGPIATQLIATQTSFLDLSLAEYEQLQENIVRQWPQIQAIAATVPSPQALAELLHKVGAATDVAALGLSGVELEKAISNSHYLRNRFTSAKLDRMLGLI
jgi:glycerol dehydrogenase-like iron-containing ADH family enzyme